MPRSDQRNTSRYWHDRGLAGLSLLQADFTTHEYAPHRHDGLVIAVTEQGGAIIRNGGQTFEARPALLFVSNPAVPQAARMGRSQRWLYRSLYLAEPALSEVRRHIGMPHEPHFVQSALDDPELCKEFASLHRELTDAQDGFRELELLVAAFGRLFARHGAGHGRVEAVPTGRRLHHVVELMQEEFRDTIQLADLAETAGLTVFQLIGLFRRATGLTPHSYLVQLRLNAARRQLRQGASLAEAAAASGFYDQSALTRHFKRCHGITPGQYVAAVRG
ncbi:MAG TPA: AraC family transcriptional regulator [Acetobacteraceae bacterium]|nr:AraC family transcriptional regulator [Acetobacteraceae bacterium]